MNQQMVLSFDFDRAHRTAVLRDLLALVSRRSNRLASYHEARRGAARGAESYRGIQAVPIARIVGSVDRANDFDRSFLPRKRHSNGRWVRVARAYVEGRELPPVQLYEIGGEYFVQDGHHRISVARFNGQEFIEAEVTATSLAPAGEVAAFREAVPRSRQLRRLRALVGALARLWGSPARPSLSAPTVGLVCSRCAAACSCA
jgi:hypothetical protein